MKYAVNAANLLEKCLARLKETIELDTQMRHRELYEMEKALVESEHLLHEHLVQLLAFETDTFPDEGKDGDDALPASLADTVAALLASSESMEKENIHGAARKTSKKAGRTNGHANESKTKAGPPPYSRSAPRQYYQSRSATDKLLFRLIVTLQLCLVRIEDAYLLISRKRKRRVLCSVVAGCTGLGTVLVVRRDTTSGEDLRGVIHTTGKTVVVVLTTSWALRGWNNLWMASKLMKSTAVLLDWQQQWLVVQAAERSNTGRNSPGADGESRDTKSQRLLEYTLSHRHEVTAWGSVGDIRFLFIKRAMDLFYAAVGTAVEFTKGSTGSAQRGSWSMPLATFAAASYYSLTGPSKRASQAVSSPSSSDLIRSAWGMVSLPSVKSLSLTASRLLKGAAVADRITIAGVSCFILSRDPVPELSAALKRFQLGQKRRRVSRLQTINERPGSQSNLLDCGYPQRNVILHITAGGFFAHTIASDIPFLLDWSAKTGAVVICPEYSLLPDNTYPVALNEVTNVYCELVGGGSASLLNFQVNRIVLTGESTGGNIATALCVKLCTDHLSNVDAILGDRLLADQSNQGSEPRMEIHRTNEMDFMEGSDADSDVDFDHGSSFYRLPDAIMLSCPALNLTLELSPSRVTGVSDPVLPSGLLSAISDAYLPESLGVSKKDPSASPLYASDAVLKCFPPTFIIASSEGPLLDDSLTFSSRLMRLGIESDLRAAHHMPHAYWGLSTAGFPEARQVQQECQEWLVHQFSRESDEC